MSNKNFFKDFYGKITIVLTVLALQGCAYIYIPVTMIDDVPYRKEKVEEYVSLWNKRSNELLQFFNNQLSAEFDAYMNFLESLSVIPTPYMTENNEFLKRFSDLTKELVSNINFTKSNIRTELVNCAIGKYTLYKIDSTYKFDELFQNFHVISVDGNMYPLFTYNLIDKGFVPLWNERLNELHRAYNNQLTVEFDACLNFSGSFSVISTPDMAENNEFLKRYSDLTEELFFNINFTKSNIRAILENFTIGKFTPFKIDYAYKFDDLFRDIHGISVDGNMFPLFVYNIIDKAFVPLWNERSNELLQLYINQFSTELKAYMNFLGNLSVVPSPDMAENNEFLKRFSGLAEEFVININFTKSQISTELENYAIGENIPVIINCAFKFDELFQDIQLQSVNGNMYSHFIYNIIQEYMAETSKEQQLHLFNELEKAYTNIFAIRKNNSKDFAKWVNGWGNYFTKPIKELFGTWAEEYDAQYDERINNGVDSGLPERIVTQAKNRADILLYGYINVLDNSVIDYHSSDIVLVQQEIDLYQFLIPYTLIQYVFYAGEIVGVDISAWRQEINNRIGGGIAVTANIFDIAIIVASKFHPVAIAADLGFRTIGALWHKFTKDGKAAELEAEIKTALDNQLNEILSILSKPLENDILLCEADA